MRDIDYVTRREFLKTAALGVVGLVAGGAVAGRPNDARVRAFLEQYEGKWVITTVSDDSFSLQSLEVQS